MGGGDEVQALRDVLSAGPTLSYEWDGHELAKCRRAKLNGEGHVAEL